jgi:hypothetical protein
MFPKCNIILENEINFYQRFHIIELMSELNVDNLHQFWNKKQKGPAPNASP